MKGRPRLFLDRELRQVDARDLDLDLDLDSLGEVGLEIDLQLQSLEKESFK